MYPPGGRPPGTPACGPSARVSLGAALTRLSKNRAGWLLHSPRSMSPAPTAHLRPVSRPGLALARSAGFGPVARTQGHKGYGLGALKAQIVVALWHARALLVALWRSGLDRLWFRVPQGQNRDPLKEDASRGADKASESAEGARPWRWDRARPWSPLSSATTPGHTVRLAPSGPCFQESPTPWAEARGSRTTPVRRPSGQVRTRAGPGAPAPPRPGTCR